MSIQIKIDLKKLYEKLCPKCRKAFVELAKESLDEGLILQAFGIKKEEKE
jgi:hypothetical protein